MPDWAREKHLQAQCLAEKHRETKLYLTQAHQRLTQKEELLNLTQWFEVGLRDDMAHQSPAHAYSKHLYQAHSHPSP